MAEDRQFLYKPPPVLESFHLDPSFARFVIGPYGSGKSTAMIMELLRIAATQAPAKDGIRYTRMAIVRNTLQSIKQTTLPDIQMLLGPIVRYKVSDSRVEIRAGDIHSDWILIPLEEPEDVRRLLSLQLTMAFLEEFRELDHNILASVSGRVGRYPSAAMGGPTRYGVIGSSNPFAEGTSWHKFLVVQPTDDYRLFKQPSGVSPEGENVENLPKGYYDRLATNHSEEWVKVHVHGEFGDDLSGTTVFKTSFSFDRHTTNGLIVQPNQTLVVGLDIGRTPTAIIGQLDAFGRLLVHREVNAADMGLEQFLAERLKPVLYEERFANRPVAVVFDPSGVAKAQINELSAWDVLRAAGLNAVPAPTNDLEPRLRAVESLLLQNRGAHSAVIIDRDGCPQLITALRFEYKYKRKKDGDTEDQPTKSHPWSDLADALQYLCLGVQLNLPGKIIRQLQRRLQPKRQRVSALAWT